MAALLFLTIIAFFIYAGYSEYTKFLLRQEIAKLKGEEEAE